MCKLYAVFFFLMIRRPPRSTLFPLHDALPISEAFTGQPGSFVPVAETLQAFKAITEGEYDAVPEQAFFMCGGLEDLEDRKSTRLNSSHANISYAVFCLKKKNDLILIPTRVMMY